MDKLGLFKELIELGHKMDEVKKTIGCINYTAVDALHFSTADKIVELAEKFKKDIQMIKRNSEDYPYEIYFNVDDIRIFAILSEEEKIEFDKLEKGEERIS